MGGVLFHEHYILTYSSAKILIMIIIISATFRPTFWLLFTQRETDIKTHHLKLIITLPYQDKYLMYIHIWKVIAEFISRIQQHIN